MEQGIDACHGSSLAPWVAGPSGALEQRVNVTYRRRAAGTNASASVQTYMNVHEQGMTNRKRTSRQNLAPLG